MRAEEFKRENLKSAKKFLECFHRGEDKIINIRIFSDRKNSNFLGKNLSFNIDDFENKCKILAAHNEANRGIFFVVNSGGNCDRDIEKINAQFFECDTLSLNEQLENIESFPIRPSIIVKTKKSLHVYFLIKGGDVSRFRDIQRNLAKHFKGDFSCINESRVMRVPGFYHCKGEKVLVECITLDKDLIYTQEEVERALILSENDLTVNEEKNEEKENKKEERNKKIYEKSPLKGERTGLEVVCSRCDFLRHCKENSKDLKEPLWHGMITNLALFKGGESRIHSYSKDYIGYSKEETSRKISNFLKSGAGPMTCKTIEERGYKCKRYGKECTGKSPASLAYKKISIRDFRCIIKDLKVSEVSMADNIESSLRFIENFMYNTKLALGKGIIYEDLAPHFKIKNARDLISYYKEVLKSFKRERLKITSEEKKDKIKTLKNFSWYEEQERGLKFLPYVLAKHLSETCNVYYGGEAFLIYENGVYKISCEKDAGRIIMGYMLPNYCTMAFIRDCRDQWEILVSRDFDDFNKNPYIINLKNGLLDIRSMSFKKHSPNFLSTVQLNTSYNPYATCPRFLKFLREVLDFRLIPIVQEIFGYLLTTNTTSQKAFVLWGPARTGKSTILWVLEYLLLGERNVCNIPWQEIGDKFKTAELLGKLANIFSDLPSKAIEDTGMFKVITGEDYLMAERKNKNPFKFKPFSRLLFSCNDLPRNYVDKTEGFYRRLIIVPFSKQIDKDRVDKSLKEKFKEEREGILNWALEGLKRLYENDFEFSENNLTDMVKLEYRRENNNVIPFVEECCELDPLFTCSRIEIYECYKEFCKEAGLGAISQIRFNKELESNFKVFRTRNQRLRLWGGIRILADDFIIR